MIPDMEQNKRIFCSLPPLWPWGQGGGGAQPPTPTSYLLQEEAKAKAEGLLEVNPFRKKA